MILSAYAKLRESYNGTVIIDSEDTDVYIQVAYVTHDLPHDLFIKSKNTLFKCADLASINIANLLILLHVITGCDRTSGFYGRGKKCVFELSDELSDGFRDDMRRFVLLKIYEGKETTCAEARPANWRKMKKILYIIIWIELTIYLTYLSSTN